jgi:hypothetical protein
MNYLGNVLLGLDLFVSALTAGKPGETLSGRAGSAYKEGHLRGKIFCPLIDWIMWAVRAYPTPRGHCVHAIQGDIIRAQAVIADQSRT